MNESQKRILGAICIFRKLRLVSVFPGISFSEFATLSAIEHFDGTGSVKISKIAEVLDVAAPAVSRTLRGLEGRGYVLRSIDRSDRRNIYVEITLEGSSILKETEQILGNIYENVYNKMGAEAMEQLAEGLENFYSLCKEEIENHKIGKKEE